MDKREQKHFDRRMRPAAILGLVLACSSSLACGDASSEQSSSDGKQADAATTPRKAPEPPPPPPPPPPPKWLLLPWDTKLRTAPDQYAPALTLIAPTDANIATAERGRVVAVVGTADREGRWWKLETVGRAQLETPVEGTVPGDPIEGLGTYALAFYVPAGTGEPLQPGKLPPPDPEKARQLAIEQATQFGIIGVLNGDSGALTQSGEPRPPGLTTEWQLDPGAQVYWPNGTSAGTVRQLHAFVQPGEPRKIESRELRCFAIRVGPPVKSPTELCFDPAAVRTVETLTAVELYPADGDVDVWGGLVGEVPDYGEGGLGMGLINLGARSELDELIDAEELDNVLKKAD